MAVELEGHPDNVAPAIFGGLVVSQLLTLFTTPVVYLFFDRLGQRFKRQGAMDSEAAYAGRAVAAGRFDSENGVAGQGGPGAPAAPEGAA